MKAANEDEKKKTHSLNIKSTLTLSVESKI